MRSDKPVVVVGSMRPPDAVVFDGAANLVAAVRVAAAAESRGRGTLVVMNEEIHGARDVDQDRRAAARRVPVAPADGSASSTPIASSTRGGPRSAAAPQSEFDVQSLSALPRVDVLLTYQGAPGDLIRAAVDNGAAGIVLATAAGGTSGTQLDGVRYAIGRRVVVVSGHAGPAAGRVVATGDPGASLAVARHARRRRPHADQGAHPADAGPGAPRRSARHPADAPRVLT